MEFSFSCFSGSFDKSYFLACRVPPRNVQDAVHTALSFFLSITSYQNVGPYFKALKDCVIWVLLPPDFFSLSADYKKNALTFSPRITPLSSDFCIADVHLL